MTLKIHKVTLSGESSSQEDVFIDGADEQAVLDARVANIPSAAQVANDAAISNLKESDGQMARVGEDVISLLITKGVITFDELPQDVQDKITSRQALRADLI